MTYFSRGNIYEPGLQAKKLQNYEETRVFHYRTHSRNYEPNPNEPRKDWKKIILSWGD